MGTRADFYIGIDKDAEWLGSIAWDGYPEGIDSAVLDASTLVEFRTALNAFFAKRDDVTLPENGWPWPWNDSNTTDCAYAFHGVGCLIAGGNGWITMTQRRAYNEAYSQYDDGDLEDEPEEPKGLPVDFPDMSDRKNVQFGGKKSGLIVVGF